MRKGKWTALPYIKALDKLSQNPELRWACCMSLTTPLLTSTGESPQEDILDDSTFNGNFASQRGWEVTTPPTAEM